MSRDWTPDELAAASAAMKAAGHMSYEEFCEELNCTEMGKSCSFTAEPKSRYNICCKCE